MKSLLKLIAVVCILQQNPLQAQKSSSYSKEIEGWDKKREMALKKKDGWLNLAGLYWLQPGENNFGSSASNRHQFVHPAMPAVLGSFVWKENAVFWKPGNNITMKEEDGKPFVEGLVFQLDSAKGTTLQWGQFVFTIIKREEKIGIRFRDLQSPTLLEFKGIPRFPANPAWKVTASLEPAYGKKIPITNVLGQTSMLPSPGKLVFNIKGKTYKLDAIDEGGTELFILFGDATSGLETYPAGRFMYVTKPDANNQTILDFNKAFNPPCAFTDFATCPLPPRQNILDIEVKAGEKTMHAHNSGNKH